MKTRSGLRNAILSLLPETLAKDLGDNIESTIQTYFEDMNLVSRQEFEVQQKVLLKTRMKLEALERKMAELEQKG